MIYAYAPEARQALAGHGLQPGPGTRPGLVREALSDLYRYEIRRLRAILHRAKSEGLDAQNRDGRPNFRDWLRGKIAFVSMVRPDTGAKLKAALDALGERPV